MFWEIAGVLAQLAQMVAQLSTLNKYKGKLEDLAQWLCDTADDNRDQYLIFRGRDPDFFTYYQTLPDYVICESAIIRGKGAALHGWGSQLRRTKRTVRGYNQMANVHLNNLIAVDAIAQSGLHRAVTNLKENKRYDDHILERWSAIVGAPVGVEKYYAGATNNIIEQSFRNIKALGQGFNSAASGFGSKLYEVLN